MNKGREYCFMDLLEYENVKKLSYFQYCDYLQNKYGIGWYPYMTVSWNKNNRASRTTEGLVAHHKFEDRAIMLSHKEWAMKHPYEWQMPQNLIYCDYLEHLLLHILICENSLENKDVPTGVGIGGIINYLVPELNDFYSGCEPKPEWKKTCLDKVKVDKNVYLALLKRFKENCKENKYYTPYCLYKTYTPNGHYCSWSIEKNKKLFFEISKL